MNLFRYVENGLYTAVMAILLFAACHSADPHKGRIPLAGVDDTYLYKDEVDLMYAVNGNGEDSIAYVESYIKKWIIETLFYNKAQENVALDNDIERRVEMYRRNLILNDYQEKLVVQQLEPTLSNSEILDFYNSNLSMFDAEESLMKGYFLKVPSNSPRINDLRKWCVGKSEEDLEKIEKYCLTKDAVFECFFEEWLPIAGIAAKTPLTEYQLKERLLRKKTIEFNDKSSIYFISADTLIMEGDSKPVEMVSGEIKELLLNSKMTRFIKERKSALYDEAVQNNSIRIYNKKKP